MKIATIKTASGEVQALSLKSGSYYLNDEIITKEQLVEYDQLGVLTWESEELRQMALAASIADAANQEGIPPLSNPTKAVSAESFLKKMTRCFISKDDYKGWRIAGRVVFILLMLWWLLAVLLAISDIATFYGGLVGSSLYYLVLSLFLTVSVVVVFMIVRQIGRLIEKDKRWLAIPGAFALIIAGVIYFSFFFGVETGRVVDVRRIDHITFVEVVCSNYGIASVGSSRRVRVCPTNLQGNNWREVSVGDRVRFRYLDDRGQFGETIEIISVR